MRTFENLRRLPNASIFGTLGPSTSHRLELQKELARQSDPLMRGRLLHSPIVFTCSPESAHEVLVTKAKSFEKAPGIRVLLNDLGGEGLFTSEGTIWKTQRKLMSPLFQPAPIHRYAETMRLVTERAAARMHDGMRIDLAQETTRIAMSIVGKALLDIDTFDEADALGHALSIALRAVNANIGNPMLLAHILLRDATQSLADRTTGRLRALALAAHEKVASPFLLTGLRSAELIASIKLIDERIQGMIDERRKQGLERNDLLTRLMSAKDPDGGGERMSDRQIRDEAVTIFVAGHETTATALAWSFYLLARHPEALARVRAEADAFGDGPIESWEPARLAYSTRVFREAMRLYPPVMMLPRRTTEDVELGGVLIPKHTVVLVSAYAQHYRADSYPEPEKFDPDRWLPEREATRHRSSYLPFSAGPRFCIGMHFAMMEGPLVLAQLLRKFDFEIDPRAIEEDDYATLRPRGGVPAIVRKRTPAVGRLAS